MILAILDLEFCSSLQILLKRDFGLSPPKFSDKEGLPVSHYFHHNVYNNAYFYHFPWADLTEIGIVGTVFLCSIHFFWFHTPKTNIHELYTLIYTRMKIQNECREVNVTFLGPEFCALFKFLCFVCLRDTYTNYTHEYTQIYT